MIKIKDYKLCNSIASKALGLMFRFKVPKPYVFIFNREQITPLHMFFVFMPIDILFLNKNFEVVELKQSLKPFQLYTPKEKSQYVIELKNNEIKEKNIKLKDKISLCLDSIRNT